MTPYGCHNTPRDPGYYVRTETVVMDDPSQPTSLVLDQLVAWIEDTSSRNCQYRKTTTDPRCEGCEK